MGHGGTRKGQATNFAPDPSKGKHPPSSSTAQPSSSTGQVRQQQPYTTGNDLAHKMNGLSMEDVRDAQKQMMRLPERDVRWDKKQGTFLYKAGGKAYPVDKHDKRHGIVLVKIQNETYRGREV
ncbi:MAG: hypothetical protein Q9204_005474 [Flavoplaca sp. TL-2023a]